MSREFRGSCGRKCCWTPYVCRSKGECACHRPKRSPFQLLAEEAAGLKKEEEES